MVSLIAVCSLLFVVPLSSGQENGLNLSGTSNCAAVDFDSYADFVNGPGDYYSAIINKRNISSHTCIFDGLSYGPSFVPEPASGSWPFTLHYEQESRPLKEQQSLTSPITVKPGEVARQTFRWKTKPPSEAAQCVQASWMSGPVLVAARSLLKKVCSDIEVSEFKLGSSAEAASMMDNAQAPAFRITSDRTKYYEGEMFPLHVFPAQVAPEQESGAGGCPTFYLRQRSPNGDTRVDEVQPLAFEGCKWFIPGRRRGNWQSGFDLDSGANSRWGGSGEHAFQVLRLKDSLDDPQIRFASSNVLRIQFADPSTISRKWGLRVKGIAVDITLEKDTYEVGEDVPLHIAIENFDAGAPVFSMDPMWHPCSVVSIEVQDAEGRSLPPYERFPSASVCIGSGPLGPRPYEKGKIVPLERTLSRENFAAEPSRHVHRRGNLGPEYRLGERRIRGGRPGRTEALCSCSRYGDHTYSRQRCGPPDAE